jgi:hypothetical protein
MPTNNLTWTPAGGAVTSQRIKRGTEPNPTTTLATVGATASSYSDTTAVAKNDYYYVVESVCANGDAVSNEVTICNDGDVSAPVCLGGITLDETNAPYTGFILDTYLGNVYGGHNASTGTVAHHVLVYNPGYNSNPSLSNPFVAGSCSTYSSTNNPYGYCDGIFGGYYVDSTTLPGFYNNSVFYYFGLQVERSSDGGTTKEVVGNIDPSTQSFFTTLINNSTSTVTAAPRVHQHTTDSELNTTNSTVNFRPTGTDSIYYTLYTVTPTNIAPVTFYLEHEYDDQTPSPSFLTKSRFRIKYGVIVNNSDLPIGGCENLTDGDISNVSETSSGLLPSTRNAAFDASNNLYIDVEAFEPYSGGTAGTTKVVVQYSINGGSTQTLGTVYSPPYTGNSSSKTTQRLTLSRNNYQKVAFSILVTGATDAEAAANSGGGA